MGLLFILCFFAHDKKHVANFQRGNFSSFQALIEHKKEFLFLIIVVQQQLLLHLTRKNISFELIGEEERASGISHSIGFTFCEVYFDKGLKQPEHSNVFIMI